MGHHKEREKHASFAMKQVSKVHTRIVGSIKYIPHKSIASHGGESPRLAHKSLLNSYELLHVDIIRESRGSNRCFFVHYLKVIKGLSEKQVSRSGGHRQEAIACTCALRVKYKCLKNPFNFLGCSGTYGSQLILPITCTHSCLLCSSL